MRKGSIVVSEHDMTCFFNAILNSAFYLRKFHEPNFLSCIGNILLISSIMRNRDMKNFLHSGDCLFFKPPRGDYLQEWMSWILVFYYG